MYLYYKGILHRDVSTGNILISYSGPEPNSTSGCLIDLDYTKMATGFLDRQPIVVNIEGQDRKVKLRCVALGSIVESLHEPGIDYDATAKLISRVGMGMAVGYVEDVLASNPSLKETN